jgi:CubicO group peptidase (beta-lactamase class C family)
MIVANRFLLGKILHSVSSGTYVPSIPTTSQSPSHLDPKSKPEPQAFSADTVCWIASCTKLMTSIAAMQCVERGLLTLDADISNILTEFKDIQILVSIDEEKGPVYKPATRKITLRNLLTHSSGLAYEFTNPKLFAWRQWFNRQSPANKAQSRSRDAAIAYQTPLMFEPDEGWAYSYGMDWAGVAVSRVSKLSLQDYMQKNIWTPLGMTSTTFYIHKRPDLQRRMASISDRADDGKLTRGVSAQYNIDLFPVDESGGGGCSSTANDYIKLLTALLAPKPKILRPETIDLMFSPNLANAKHLMRVHANPLSYGLAGNIPIDSKLDYGLGGILNMEVVSTTGRAKGGMQWGGLPNLFWWINRKEGVCGCYFGQLMPAGDRKSFEMYEAFERAINESFLGGNGIKGKL